MSLYDTKASYEDNVENLKLAHMGDAEALSRLMEANMPLVHSISRKFCGRGTDIEDLIQIGSIGLLRAIRTFDFSRGTVLSTYAVPLIVGEVRRYLRDDGTVKVSRAQKTAAARLLHQKEKFVMDHGFEPTLGELAALCEMDVADAAIALDAASPVRSLSEPVGDEGELVLGDTLTADDTAESTVEMIALKESLTHLPALWRKIVILRFYKNYTQKQTADLLGLTQVKISREEKKIFDSLRRELAV